MRFWSERLWRFSRSTHVVLQKIREFTRSDSSRSKDAADPVPLEKVSRRR
jgi:hypothetical protein